MSGSSRSPSPFSLDSSALRSPVSPVSPWSPSFVTSLLYVQAPVEGAAGAPSRTSSCSYDDFYLPYPITPVLSPPVSTVSSSPRASATATVMTKTSVRSPNKYVSLGLGSRERAALAVLNFDTDLTGADDLEVARFFR